MGGTIHLDFILPLSLNVCDLLFFINSTSTKKTKRAQ